MSSLIYIGLAAYSYSLGRIDQAISGIILAQKQSALCTAGEYSVWFICPLSHQIVDHHAYVGILTADYQRFFPARTEYSVYTSHKPLRGGFFITRRAVYLSGKKQSGNSL